jgi:hypothetical protein
MIKVKLSIPGFGNNLNLSQYLGNNDNNLDNCRFYVNDNSIKEVDYWFILDDLQYPKESVKVQKQNVFFLTAEHIFESGYYDTSGKILFLNQFYNILSSYDIFRENARYETPFLGWMINANHGVSIFSESIRDINWLKKYDNFEKPKLISVFCSSKISTPSHLVRYKFVKKLKEHFGEQIDWFGNGINSIPQKWDGIAPYKYHVVLENQSRHNILSEKLYDSYLGLSFPFYWGAPNISEFFHSDSFETIEILDWKAAISKIEKNILNNRWIKSKELLLDSKHKVLTNYNPFYRILKIINNSENSLLNKTQIELLSISEIKKNNFGLDSRIKNKLGNFLVNMGNKLKIN